MLSRRGVIREYREATRGSRRLYEKACRLMPGGVSHNIRFFEPYPFYTSKAVGAYLWDVDGNRYCDYWMGHTALILGHSPKPVVEAVKSQVEVGTQFGTVNPIQVELAEKVVNLVPSAEEVRFCNSGTEAAMYAVRLARAYTKRRYIVKIRGGWHGGSTLLNKSVTLPLDKPESTGIAYEEQMYVEPIPFNDLEAAREVLARLRGDVACIIVEPMLKGCIPADREYLKGLREETSKEDVLLVFDEVITGFRLSLGGGQEYYGVTPDLTAMGKIVGGGFPVGAVAGLAEVMEKANPRKHGKGELCWIGGGTFSCNPITMTAGLATLRFLEENREKIYGKIGSLGEEARTRIHRLLEDHRVNHVVLGLESLLNILFTKKPVEKIWKAEDLETVDWNTSLKFYLALTLEGIFFLPTHTGAVSYAHTESDIEDLVSAVETILEGKHKVNLPKNL